MHARECDGGCAKRRGGPRSSPPTAAGWTAAAIPGVEVAGKTGTAELRPTAGGPANPSNTNPWFVAFAPAHSPRVAVAVMLIGAGAGGQAAAPIARRVPQAAL